jgi:hypothetical protein
MTPPSLSMTEKTFSRGSEASKVTSEGAIAWMSEFDDIMGGKLLC